MVALLTLALMGQLVTDDSDRPPPLLRRALDPWGGYFSAITPDRPPDICACQTALPSRDGAVATITRTTSATCERKGFATTGIAEGDLVVCPANTARVIQQTDGGAAVYLESDADNYELRSREIDHVAWTKVATGVAVPVVTANYANGPFGTQTAERIQFAACPLTTNMSVISQTVTPVSSPFSASVYCRATSGTPNISACVYSTGAGDRLCTSHTLSTSYFTRILSENRTFTTNTDFTFGCENRTGFYTGASNTGAADVICEAVQVETGAYATSFIDTTTAITTREQDEFGWTKSIPTGPGLCTAATVEFRALSALVGGAGLWSPQLTSGAVTAAVVAPYWWPYSVSTGSNLGIDPTSSLTPSLGYSASAIDPQTGTHRYVALFNGTNLSVCRDGVCAVSGTAGSWSSPTYSAVKLNVNNALRQAASWSNIQVDQDSSRCTR